MLIRKLRQKYIDDNEAFSQYVKMDRSIDESTASILQDNFKANYRQGRTRSTASNLSQLHYKTGSNASNASSRRIGNSINILPKIRN